MTIPKINSAHGSETRNIINRAIDVLNYQGKSIQDLVAEGQLTPTQYSELIKIVNSLVSKGEIITEDLDKNNFSIDETMITDSLRSIITGNAPIHAVPANESLATKKYLDNSVTTDKSSFIQVGKNLHNMDKMTGGMQLRSDGSLSAHASYNVSEFIPVKAGRKITLNEPRHVSLYDLDLNFLEFIDNGPEQNALTVTPKENGYLRATIQNARVGRFQVEEGSTVTSYEPYKEIINYLEVDGKNIKSGGITGANIANDTIEKSNLDFLISGKNMYNPSNDLLEHYIDQGNGTLYNVVNFRTSDYIRVKKGVPITFSGLRKYAFFDNDKTFRHGADNSPQGKYTVTPDSDGYIRFSYRTTDPNGTNIQMEIGSTVTSYEPYFLTFPDLTLTASQKASGGSSGALSVLKQGNIFTLSSSFGDGEIVQKVQKRNDGNKVFNFAETVVDGKMIHSNNDDVAPIRTYNTVGANHGYTVVSQITYAHDKTSADLGSTWTDGVDEFVILDVEPNQIIIGKKYYEIDGEYRALNANPITNLTHVQGATHTTSINISNITGTQLHPSTNKHTVEYYVDGKRLVGEETSASGEKFQVIESYNIMSYKGVYDWAKNNVGKSYKNDNIPGYVNVSITYTFLPGGKCNISHTLKPLEKITFGRSGFLQSVALSSDGYTLHRYMPNVKSKDGYDFKNVVNMTNYNSTILYDEVDLINPNLPVNRYTDVLKTSSGKVLAGYSMGYLVDKTNSKHADRISNASNFWDMRATKKAYPNAINDIVLEPGDYMNFHGYRNYISEKEMADATNINIVEDSNSAYVYIDYHKNVTLKNVRIPNHIGRNIEIIESENFNILNDIVDSNGVTFNITNGYGYAILKLI